MKLRFILSLLLMILSASALFGHEGHEDDSPPPARIEAAEQHKPTVLPDRVVLSWSGDPVHSQDVNWRTSTAVSKSFVEYAVATPGPYFVKNAARIEAETAPFESDLGTSHRHSATMKALAANTKYAYRVGDGNNWSEWFHFTTASTQPEPFSFIYFGDAQNDVRSLWSRIIREAHADAPRAAFILHAGDLVNVANRDSEWGEWFGGGGWLNAMIPSIATPGNHEYGKEKVVVDGKEETIRTLSEQWKPTFSFPMNGPDGLKESVYWIDFQGTRIISLNSNEQHEIQAKWVEQVLASNRQNWTIITFHHPMYSSAKGRDNVELRKLWKPIFDKHKVDLVLQGHDHTYGRTGLELPVSVENLETGVTLKAGPTTYVVSVSGPKQYNVEEREFFHRKASGAQLYQIISIDGNTLKFEARVANGELYDAFTLQKQVGELNVLTDLVPATPETRKPQEIDYRLLTTTEATSEEKPSQGQASGEGGRGGRGRTGGRPRNPEVMFSERDANKDGKLSKEELPRPMQAAFERMDNDKDGGISLEELTAAFAARRARGQ